MNIYIYIHIDHAWWLTRFTKWVKNPSYVCGISRLNPATSLGLGSFATSPAALQVMLRNLPNNYTRDMLLTLLDDKGFAGRPLDGIHGLDVIPKKSHGGVISHETMWESIGILLFFCFVEGSPETAKPSILYI